MKKIFMFLLLLPLLTACIERPIENYKGGVICGYDPYTNGYIQATIKMKDDDNIYNYCYPYINKFDADRYIVGDTIK